MPQEYWNGLNNASCTLKQLTEKATGASAQSGRVMRTQSIQTPKYSNKSGMIDQPAHTDTPTAVVTACAE